MSSGGGYNHPQEGGHGYQTPGGGGQRSGQHPMSHHHSGQEQDQDPWRRELRRPMQPTPDDVARGMARMDPFNHTDYANYSNPSGNTYGGGSMVAPPPRPAPSADGWSSGENQYCAYNPQHSGGLDYGVAHTQQQMSQQAKQASCGPQWRSGAAEFVPKSNLSAAAAEFVPYAMPRNSSQWGGGYQNQPQQQNFYQAPAQPVKPSYHQTSSYGGGGGGGVVNPYLTESAGGSSSLYNVEEQLSDAIATIVYMPTKLDRTCKTIADKINSSTVDFETLQGLANSLMDICLSDLNFRPLAGRFCASIAQDVNVSFESGSMLSLLIARCQILHVSHLDLMSRDPETATFVVEFMSNFLYHLDLYGCTKVERLSDMLFDIFNNLFTVGSANFENLRLATEMLKICGKALENDEKRRMGNPNVPKDEIQRRPTPKVDQLMSLVAKMSNDDDTFPEATRRALQEILDYRARGIWGTPSCLPALPAAANEVTKPRSNAILIEPDPNDSHVRNNAVVISNNARNSRVGAIPNQDMALTEEELAFMNEHMGGNASPGDSDLVGVRISTSGDEDDMPDDIRAAYEEFLEEQNRSNSGRNRAS